MIDGSGDHEALELSSNIMGAHIVAVNIHVYYHDNVNLVNGMWANVLFLYCQVRCLCLLT